MMAKITRSPTQRGNTWDGSDCKCDGIFRQDSDSGWLEFEVPYNDGKQDGLALRYNANGAFIQDEAYVKGVIDGPSQVMGLREA